MAKRPKVLWVVTYENCWGYLGWEFGFETWPDRRSARQDAAEMRAEPRNFRNVRVRAYVPRNER